MGKIRHKLSDIDIENKIGRCSVCGLVKINKAGINKYSRVQWKCSNKNKQVALAFQKKEREDKILLRFAKFVAELILASHWLLTTAT